MDNPEIKNIISALLNEGRSLSDIQKELQVKHSVTLTFLDLRILAAELESVDWSKQDPKKPDEPAKPLKKPDDKDEPVDAELVDEQGAALEDEFDDEAATESSGKTVVELNKLVRPGAALSGSVKFASGASADWVLDQYGRLGLEKPVGKPTNDDLREFQMELQKLLSRGGV